MTRPTGRPVGRPRLVGPRPRWAEVRCEVTPTDHRRIRAAAGRIGATQAELVGLAVCWALDLVEGMTDDQVALFRERRRCGAGSRPTSLKTLSLSTSK